MAPLAGGYEMTATLTLSDPVPTPNQDRRATMRDPPYRPKTSTMCGNCK
jgi:hypothetical protein